MSSETFYQRLDRIEQENRIKRIFADRPENLHDYQGCAKDAAESLPAKDAQEMTEAELDAELRANGIAPREIDKKMLEISQEIYQRKKLQVQHDFQANRAYVAEARVKELEDRLKEKPEVLPAQPAPICHYHNGPFQKECPLGGKCERVEDWGKAKPEPVAPVEAKEKERYAGHTPGGPCDKCHEPKPTPSTSAPIEAFCPKCRISITNTTAGVHECPSCHGPVEKPQTDSSSISTEQTWLDLPSGSGYWWHHDGNPDLRPFIYHIQVSLTGSPRYFIDFPDSRWCDEVGGKWMKVIEPIGWNAAKGQSNGR